MKFVISPNGSLVIQDTNHNYRTGTVVDINIKDGELHGEITYKPSPYGLQEVRQNKGCSISYAAYLLGLYNGDVNKTCEYHD
jgi:hypothetical protein